MKKFLTTLCLLLALCVTNSFAITYYMQEDFTNGYNGWTSVDLDGNKLTAEAVSAYNGYFKTSYTTSSTTGWEAVVNSGNGYMVSCSYTTPNTAIDDWLISPEIQIPNETGILLQYYLFPLSSSYADGYQLYITDASLTNPQPSDFTTLLTSENAASGGIYNISLKDYAGKTVRIAFRNNSKDKYFLLLDYVYVMKPDDYDLAIYNVEAPSYVSTDNASGASFNISVANLSGKDITSFDVSYQADGEEMQTMTVTNPAIEYYSYKTFTITPAWKPTTLGDRTINFTISNINGTNATDATPDNNVASVNSYVWSKATAASYNPLYELFTSATCGPCYSIGETYGNTKLLDNNVKNKGLVLVKYQTAWPGNGDPYTNDDVATRVTYYGVTGVPSAFANGAAYEFTSSSISQTAMDAIYEVPGRFIIENAKYSIEGTNINVSFTVKPYSDMTSNQIYARVAVFENVTTGNASTNQETEFHHVEMKMLPNPTGTKITKLTAGEETILQLTGDMSGTFTEEMDDLGVAIFVQDDATKSILQAGYATKATGVEEDNDGNGIISLYPNPTADFAHIEYAVNGNQQVSFSLFDETGNEVYSNNLGMQGAGYYTQNIDIKALASGQYFMRLTIGDRTFNDVVKVVR